MNAPRFFSAGTFSGSGNGSERRRRGRRALDRRRRSRPGRGGLERRGAAPTDAARGRLRHRHRRPRGASGRRVRRRGVPLGGRGRLPFPRARHGHRGGHGHPAPRRPCRPSRPCPCACGTTSWRCFSRRFSSCRARIAPTAAAHRSRAMPARKPNRRLKENWVERMIERKRSVRIRMIEPVRFRYVAEEARRARRPDSRRHGRTCRRFRGCGTRATGTTRRRRTTSPRRSAWCTRRRPRGTRSSATRRPRRPAGSDRTRSRAAGMRARR